MVLKRGGWPSRLLSASGGGRQRHPRGHRTSCSRKMAVVDISQRRWRRRRQGCECAQFSPRCPHSSVCSFHPSPHRRKEKWLSATFDWHRALRTGNSCSLQSLATGPSAASRQSLTATGTSRQCCRGIESLPDNKTRAALARRASGGASVGVRSSWCAAILTGYSPSSPSQRFATSAYPSMWPSHCSRPSSGLLPLTRAWRSAGRWCRLLLGTMLRGCRTRQRRLCKEWKRT
mmetsp:Transcript_33785/g.97408  ORF Transcript_33785/g.97408 Transcript_33785/m.97408 type:complete len:232 (-) Transcript_33785:655-1350(-)